MSTATPARARPRGGERTLSLRQLRDRTTDQEVDEVDEPRASAPTEESTDSPGRARRKRMPALMRGSRGWMLALLTFAGVLQGALAAGIALVLPALREGLQPLYLGLAVAFALGVGGLRMLERVVAERLGQHYVAELRRLLITAVLTQQRSPNLGITVARTTNDLTAVKNWIALGIAPMVSGVPLLLGLLIALELLQPWLGLVTGAVLALALAAVLLLTGPMFRRSRQLRRRRGRLAAFIADSVIAAEHVRAGGGVERELRRLDAYSDKVARAASRRAVTAGGMRGVAAAAGVFAMVAVGILLATLQVDPAGATVALLLAGMLAAPVSDLGRVAEYRQNYQAAMRVLEQPVAQARAYEARERHRDLRAAVSPRQPAPALDRLATPALRPALHVAGLSDHAGPIPGLLAVRGSRILVTARDRERVDALLARFLGAGSETGSVKVDGVELDDLGAAARRSTIGYATARPMFERGTIERAVRYRVPQRRTSAVALLEAVGLNDTVRGLKRGMRTELRRGGEPLDEQERTRLGLARAIAGSPQLLVLDGVADSLDREGRRMLARIVEKYPGTVLIAETMQEAARRREVGADSPEWMHGIRSTTWDLDTAGRATWRRVPC